MKKIFYNFICMMLLCPSIGNGQQYKHAGAFMTGNKLYNMLNSDRTDNLAAIMYIGGVIDGVNISKRLDETGDIIPDQSTPQQCALIVWNYMQKHPEKWQFAAGAIIINAKCEAFPKNCHTVKIE
jgi:hypothetical protein